MSINLVANVEEQGQETKEEVAQLEDKPQPNPDKQTSTQSDLIAEPKDAETIASAFKKLMDHKKTTNPQIYVFAENMAKKFADPNLKSKIMDMYNIYSGKAVLDKRPASQDKSRIVILIESLSNKIPEPVSQVKTEYFERKTKGLDKEKLDTMYDIFNQ